LTTAKWFPFAFVIAKNLRSKIAYLCPFLLKLLV
jgi:hypothetical protein